MKTVIISGGKIEEKFVLSYLAGHVFDRMAAVDKGAAFCRANGIRPDIIMGDFDSLPSFELSYYETEETIPIVRFNPEKDDTDTQMAIAWAVEQGSDEIVILGGTGTRLDHVLGNIQCMVKPLKKGIACCMQDETNRIRLIDSRFAIKKSEQYGNYVSLLALTSEVAGVTLTGFKYPLADYTLTIGSGGLGVSNEILEETGIISVGSGILVMIESKDN